MNFKEQIETLMTNIAPLESKVSTLKTEAKNIDLAIEQLKSSFLKSLDAEIDIGSFIQVIHHHMRYGSKSKAISKILNKEIKYNTYTNDFDVLYTYKECFENGNIKKTASDQRLWYSEYLKADITIGDIVKIEFKIR